MTRASAIADSLDSGTGVKPPRTLRERDIHVWIVPPSRTGGHRDDGSHAAARLILAGYLGCQPRRVGLWTDRRGKPQVAGSNLHYSLTHAGDAALVGVGRGRPLGVDVEPVRRLVERDALVRRCFTARERARVDALRTDEELLRLWVRKEAIAKATGEGLARVFDGIDVLSTRPLPGWRLVDLVTVPGHVAAAAVRDDASDVVVTRFRPAC